MKTERNLINGQKPEFGNLAQIAILQAEQKEKEEKFDYEEWYKTLSADEKWFEAFTCVDWTMGAIQRTVEDLTKFFDGRSPLDVMIDKSTGYDKGKIKGFLLYLKEAYEELIRNFKIMEDDREELYKGLLKKINIYLKTEYKNVKAAKV